MTEKQQIQRMTDTFLKAFTNLIPFSKPFLLHFLTFSTLSLRFAGYNNVQYSYMAHRLELHCCCCCAFSYHTCWAKSNQPKLKPFSRYLQGWVYLRFAMYVVGPGAKASYRAITGFIFRLRLFGSKSVSLQFTRPSMGTRGWPQARF